MSNKRIAILIPARLSGVRLPRKVLFEFNGIPMIEHVRQRASLNQESVEVFVVSGDPEIVKLIESVGGRVIQTFEDHESGTSRCEEAARNLDYDYFLIVQGDEILVLPRHIDALVKYLRSNPEIAFVNAVTKLSNIRDFEDLSIVKCALSSNNQILFMFRKPPLSEVSVAHLSHFFKVLGLFAIKKSLLHKLPKLPATPLEIFESIEQMRVIENSFEVRSFTQDCSYPSINIKEDIDKVLSVLEENEEQKKLLALISKDAC